MRTTGLVTAILVVLGMGCDGELARPAPAPVAEVVEPAVPELPAPSPAQVASHRALTPLPAGVQRDAAGRLWSVLDGAELVLVPAGEFTMGSEGGEEDEKPVRRVRSRALLVDRHEVTNGQFARFVRATRYRTEAEEVGGGETIVPRRSWWGVGGSGGPLFTGVRSGPEVDVAWVEGVDWRHPRGRDSSVEGMDVFPVAFVSWNDARAFAEWAGGRLPSEAEFERLLRGGADGADYPWGEGVLPPDRAGNYADRSVKKDYPNWQAIRPYDDGWTWASPAGTFDPNPFGLFDISGNVAEWCSDPYPGPDGYRVVRGGDWLSAGRVLRCSYRSYGDPSGATVLVGFRCVRDLP